MRSVPRIRPSSSEIASVLELKLLQHALAIGLEQLTRGGEFDILGAALEQHGADERFELFNLVRQRRLRDVQTLGRTREAARIGDSEKITQMA